MATKKITQEELLSSGVQFGHETKRWNPKMRKFIVGSKNNIHLIDVSKTLEALENAKKFLKDTAATGEVIFVGTKQQASDIIQREAVRSGSYFVNFRWAGGLLTNFNMIKQSLRRLVELEEMFETGVQDRTKYEVSQMKKEWFRLHRLYSGIKTMEKKPVAAVVIDVKYEKGALREFNKMGIPVVGIVDTNSDPEGVNYVIPANDDAIKSIELLLSSLADAVVEGNGGKGIKHNIKDYSDLQIEIKKTLEHEGETVEEVKSSTNDEPSTSAPAEKAPAARGRATGKSSQKGILGRIQESKEQSKKTVKSKK